MTDSQMFSAKFDAPLGSSGPPTSASVAGVRDVILCAKGEEELAENEFREHPPVGSKDWMSHIDSEGEDRRVGSIELGRDVFIERLDDETTELVMNACQPRGHYFFPIRQFGRIYSFVRHLSASEHEENPFGWDPDGLLQHALMFSRLIRDNGYSTQYAARITDYEDGEQQVVYLPWSQDATIFRLRRDREYLDGPEAKELAVVLDAYWQAMDTLPSRVEEAIWRVAITPRFQNGKAVNSYLCGGLEALLKTKQGPVTQQFKQRVRSLASELGVEGIDKDFLKRIYKERSDWVHGSIPVYVPAAPGTLPDGEAEIADPEIDLADIALLQDLLRAAVRRCVEDTDFRATFASDKTIRSRWS